MGTLLRSCRAFLLALLSCALPSTGAVGAPPHVPPEIQAQGYLATAAGAPVNGTVNVVFGLYDAATAGNLVWQETQSVTVNGGMYSVRLGTFQPLDPSILSGPLYLGTAVAGDAEMSPRRALSAVPYALMARQALAVGPGAVTASSLGIACSAGQGLAYGPGGWACASLTCGKGTAACGATCTNLKVDAANCGTCGNACPQGHSCVAGTCN
jgi:hypothetical protein